MPPARPATRRIIFVNRFFYPDYSATSQILSDLAFHLAANGQSVRVVTSHQRYDDSNARLPEMESVHGVAIHRLSTTSFGRAALFSRGFDYLSFYASAWRSVLRLTSTGDIVVAMTDPPLLSIPAVQAARRRGLRLVNWLQDLYPEVAAQLGVPFAKGMIGRGLSQLRDSTLRAAAANVVVSERMGEIVRSRGIAAELIHVIPNWCADEEIHPVPPAQNPLRREWGLEDRFVIGYSGNLGRAHEFETVLAAAERLRDDPLTVFLFIGGGSNFVELARRVRERNLDPLFRFLPYQDRGRLKYSLSVPDVHWISVRPEVEGLVFPSKFYGIAAAGRAMVAIAKSGGEIARLVQDRGCGLVVEPGDGPALAEALRRLRADPAVVAEMGRCARAMLDTHFTRRAAFASWESLFKAIA